MKTDFNADCLPVLIGSIPVTDHSEATDLVFRHTPEIPLWVQLPFYKEEGMVFQFLPGMPGLVGGPEKYLIDRDSENFETEFLEFFEEYMAVTDGQTDWDNSRFVLKKDTAKGFFTFLEYIENLPSPPVALKAQITGPITTTTAVKDKSGRAIFYDEPLRDAAVKLLAMKAGWQVRQLKKFGRPVILFFDEPALAGFGSSEFIAMSSKDVTACFGEVIQTVHAQGGLAGIHVCANADWALILDSPADIVSFDAYAYFDTFILYPEQIKKFLNAGKIIAWGIVPTLEPADIDKETADSLVAQWEEKAARLEALGIDGAMLRRQSLITPACGTGSLDLDHALKVLTLTCNVSKKLRSK